MILKNAILMPVFITGVLLASASVWSQPAPVMPTATPVLTAPAQKLSTQYGSWAGSPTNSASLVTGLRDGKAVTLVASPGSLNPTAPSTTFTPATGKLGYGNINIALSLAKADLAKQGIPNPTPTQLAAALNGGSITTATGMVAMRGVLAQRQEGLGWGQIANAMGVKLGPVVSASKTGAAGGKNGHAAKSGSEGNSGMSHANSSQGGGGRSGGGGNGGGGNGGGGGGGHGGK
jgi:hypothetical protein